MLKHFIEFMPLETVSILEAIGIVMITIGPLEAFYHYIKVLFTHKHYPIRIELVNALTLSLESKIGAEILRTILVRNFLEIYVLRVIILPRTLLSLMIHFEIRIEREHGSASEVSPNNY